MYIYIYYTIYTIDTIDATYGLPDPFPSDMVETHSHGTELHQRSLDLPDFSALEPLKHMEDVGKVGPYCHMESNPIQRPEIIENHRIVLCTIQF